MTDPKMAAMRAGYSVIVGDDWLDCAAKNHPDDFARVVTALNTHQIGTKDSYVAWLCDFAPPADLEYYDSPHGYQLARASATA